MTSLSSAATSQPMSIRKVALASTVGATIEWYDFFLYGTVSGLVFNKIFFPAYQDPFIATMLAYMGFAVGYLSRPVGGIIFGHFGDRIGRKNMLVLTLIIMGVSTVLIGCLPPYSSIGIWAPILLMLFRIFQGIGLGGEWGGGVLMAVEHSDQKKVGFYGSWPQMGLQFGVLLGTVVFAVLSNAMPEDQFLSWGWRIAFLISVFLVAVGLYIRLQILETPAFTRIRESGAQVRVPIMEVLRKYPRNVLLAMGARFIEGVTFNVYVTFGVMYLTTVIKLPRTTALNAVSVSMLVQLLLVPIWGILADKYGRRQVFAAGAIISGVTIFPAFWLIKSFPQYTIVIYLIMGIPFGVSYAALWASISSLFSEIFDARVRYSGMSLVYHTAGIYAAGLTPIIATYFLTISNNQPWLIAGYLLLVSIISTICVSLLQIQQLGEATNPPAQAPAPGH
ncbi:MAG: MFS transporter [Syntrophobacter sp.]